MCAEVSSSCSKSLERPSPPRWREEDEEGASRSRLLVVMMTGAAPPPPTPLLCLSFDYGPLEQVMMTRRRSRRLEIGS